MGAFRDLFKLTREARELQKSFPMPSIGESISAMRETVEAINDQQGDSARLLAEGLPGTAIVRELGVAQPDANWFNQMLDLEVHPSTRAPYRIANEYLVPQAARLAVGSELQVRIDPDDAAKLAIDWSSSIGPEPELGRVRPL